MAPPASTVPAMLRSFIPIFILITFPVVTFLVGFFFRFPRSGHNSPLPAAECWVTRSIDTNPSIPGPLRAALASSYVAPAHLLHTRPTREAIEAGDHWATDARPSTRR